MGDRSNSILSQKINSAGLAEPASPDLTRFAEALGKTVQAAISKLLDCRVEATATTDRFLLQNQFSRDPDEQAILYWINSTQAARSALVQVSAGFSSVVTERLLGGDLHAPAEDTQPTVLDFQMASSLVEVVIPAINASLEKTAHPKGQALGSGTEGFRSPEDAIYDLEASPVFRMKFSVSYGGHEAKDAFAILFMTDFLDGAGLQIRGVKRPPSADEKTAWSGRIRKNILDTELPVTIVLENVQSNIGAVSRFKVGDIIDLDPEALNRLELTVATADGKACIAKARLGAVRSKKAVKLTSGVDPRFIRGL